MLLTGSDLAQIIGNLWHSLVGEEVSIGLANNLIENPDFYAALVAITGSDNQHYAILVELSECLGRTLACNMFGQDECTIEEITDAVQEFSNIMTGEVEQCLKGEFKVGLPILSRPHDHPFLVAESMKIAETNLSVKRGLIRVLFLNNDRPDK